MTTTKNKKGLPPSHTAPAAPEIPGPQPSRPRPPYQHQRKTLRPQTLRSKRRLLFRPGARSSPPDPTRPRHFLRGHRRLPGHPPVGPDGRLGHERLPQCKKTRPGPPRSQQQGPAPEPNIISNPVSQIEKLLKKEGVKVKDDKVVDFKELFWDPAREF